MTSQTSSNQHHVRLHVHFGERVYSDQTHRALSELADEGIVVSLGKPNGGVVDVDHSYGDPAHSYNVDVRDPDVRLTGREIQRKIEDAFTACGALKITKDDGPVI